MVEGTPVTNDLVSESPRYSTGSKRKPVTAVKDMRHTPSARSPNGQTASVDPTVRHKEFKLAQHWANHYLELTPEEKLSLYGVERQAQVGDCSQKKPSFLFGAQVRGKYDAWMKNKGLSQAQAETKYIEAVHYIDPEFQSSTQWEETHTGGAPNWGSVKTTGGDSPRRRGRNQPAFQQENVEDEDGDDDEALLHIVWRRMLKGEISPQMFVASLMDSFREQAFLAITALFAIVGFLLHTMTGNVFKAKDVLDHPEKALELLKEGTDKMKQQLTGFTASPMFQNMVNKTFDQFDLDKSGSVDSTEVYCMVLFIYLKLNSFAKLTPPSMKQTNELVKQFDLDANGTLDKEEFLLLAAMLCRNVMARVVLQTSISMVGAPLFANWLTGKLAEIPSVVDPLLAAIPDSLEKTLASRTMATTMVTGVCVAVVVPFILGTVDEFYRHTARRKHKRELRRRKQMTRALSGKKEL